MDEAVKQDMITKKKENQMRQHDKIINRAAKKILAPQGLFRVGSSRIWLDDNGYFMISVEFQSSQYSRGSYLNVGISFLWEFSKEINDILTFNYGYRVTEGIPQFVDYNDNDEQFMGEMEKYAKTALQKVTEYRLFRDMDYAKEQLIQQLADIPENRQFWEPYDLALLCFLKGDYEDGKNYFEYYLHRLKDTFYVGDLYIDWHEEFYNYCVQHIQPCLTTKETARNMVLEMIQRRRDYFSSKPSYKKMNRFYGNGGTSS